MGTQITYSNKPGPVPSIGIMYRFSYVRKTLVHVWKVFLFRLKLWKWMIKEKGGGGQTNWGTALIGDLVERNSIKRGTNV